MSLVGLMVGRDDGIRVKMTGCWSRRRDVGRGLGWMMTFKELKYIRVEEVEPKIR